MKPIYKPKGAAAEYGDYAVNIYGVNAVRPLADNTMRRVIRGVDKFVIKAETPYIVPWTVTNTTNSVGGPVTDPIHTITTAGNTETARGRPRWQNEHGQVEKIQTMGAPSATAMHAQVWPEVRDDVELYLMARIQDRVDWILTRYR